MRRSSVSCVAMMYSTFELACQFEVILLCRDEIAECSERAYGSLSIPEAKRLMLFSSDRDVASYAKEVRSANIFIASTDSPE